MSLLIGAAIGLIAAIVIGYRRGRHIYQHQLEQYEPEIPRWVNQGNRAVIGTYDDIVTAIIQASDFELWEYELEDQ